MALMKPIYLKSGRRSCQTPVPDGYRLVPADGNYGWIVAFGCFISGLITSTPLPAFSVLLYELINLYEVDTASVSWVAAIYICTSFLFGPIYTLIITSIGCRKSTVLGSFLSAAGFIASYFVNHIGLLCFTYGGIAGFGAGLCLATYPVILSHYFKKYYGISVGILTGGYAACRLVIIPLTQYILAEYGCQATFLILGANMLQVCVGAALFQPAKWHMIMEPIESVPMTDDTNSKEKTEFPKIYKLGTIRAKYKNGNHSESEEGNIHERHLLEVPSIDVEIISHHRRSRLYSLNQASTWDIYGSATSIGCATMTNENKGNNANKNSNLQRINGDEMHWYKEICSKIDFNLLKEPCFYLLCVNGLLVVSVMIFSNVFLFPLGVEKGIGPVELASLLSAKAMADIIARIGGPTIVLLLNWSDRYTYIVMNIVHAVLMLMVNRTNTFPLFFIWATVSGLAFGSVISLSGMLTLKAMGAQRLSSVIGLVSFMQGLFMLPMAPALGWLRDVTGSFVHIFTVLAVMQLLLAALWLAKPYIAATKPSPPISLQR